jgi:phytoene dehydrogenase-like protein
VLVLEQHYTAGGFSHAFARGPYAWNVGVHYIGAHTFMMRILCLLQQCTSI